MAGTFRVGEVKVRPGAYFNFQKTGYGQLAGTDDGTVAIFFKADYGPLMRAVELTSEDNYVNYFGNAGTTDLIQEVLNGGAQKIVCIRVGTGGTTGSYSIKSGDDPLVNIACKHVGSKPFSITIREKVSDTTKKECIIYSGTRVFETFEFEAGSSEIDNLVAATVSSENFTFTKANGATGTLPTLSAAAFTPGTDVTASAQEYSDAFYVAEKTNFHVACIDTEDTAIQLLLSAFCDRIFDYGQLVQCVVAELPTVALATRMTHAAAFNSEKVVYVLNASVYEGTDLVQGCRVAARIAGEIAACPSNRSLTHQVLSGFTTLYEPLTPAHIITAEQRGCFVLSTNSEGQIWVDAAINTLVTPDENQDDGWKKIRRTKTRFELVRRCNKQADSLIGKVDNDENGRATVVAQLQGICNNMINEGKLQNGTTVMESTTYQSDADYAYFDIYVIDKDSIEKLYLTYIFQFSTIAG